MGPPALKAQSAPIVPASEGHSRTIESRPCSEAGALEVTSQMFDVRVSRDSILNGQSPHLVDDWLKARGIDREWVADAGACAILSCRIYGITGFRFFAQSRCPRCGSFCFLGAFSRRLMPHARPKGDPQVHVR